MAFFRLTSYLDDYAIVFLKELLEKLTSEEINIIDSVSLKTH